MSINEKDYTWIFSKMAWKGSLQAFSFHSILISLILVSWWPLPIAACGSSMHAWSQPAVVSNFGRIYNI